MCRGLDAPKIANLQFVATGLLEGVLELRILVEPNPGELPVVVLSDFGAAEFIAAGREQLNDSHGHVGWGAQSHGLDLKHDALARLSVKQETVGLIVTGCSQHRRRDSDLLSESTNWKVVDPERHRV